MLKWFPRSRSHGHQETSQRSYYLVTAASFRCTRLALVDRGPGRLTRLWSHPQGCRKYRCWGARLPAQALPLSQVYPGQLGTEACLGLVGVTSAQVARTSWNGVGSPDLFSVISILYCNIVDPQCCSAVLHQPDLVKYIMVPIFSPLVYPQRILQCGEQSLLWYFIHPW